VFRAATASVVSAVISLCKLLIHRNFCPNKYSSIITFIYDVNLCYKFGLIFDTNADRSLSRAGLPLNIQKVIYYSNDAGEVNLDAFWMLVFSDSHKTKPKLF
jgi:hypothetical protein